MYDLGAGGSYEAAKAGQSFANQARKGLEVYAAMSARLVPQYDPVEAQQALYRPSPRSTALPARVSGAWYDGTARLGKEEKRNSTFLFGSTRNLVQRTLDPSAYKTHFQTEMQSALPVKLPSMTYRA